MIRIGTIPVSFARVHSADDAARILDFVHACGNSGTVVFLDNPCSEVLAQLVSKLQEEGYIVIVRDHHDISGEPRNDRDRQTQVAANQLRMMLGGNARISTRTTHPACSMLVEPSEFADVLCIIADADPDGLITAVKGTIGIGVLAGMFDKDAELLDGPRDKRQGLSPLAALLSNGYVSLPPFDRENPSLRPEALDALFAAFAAAIQGDPQGVEYLEAQLSAYETQVQNAIEAVQRAELVASGVVYADLGSVICDVGTLKEKMGGKFAGTKIIVTRRKGGPIAAYFDEQISLSRLGGVTDVDLRDFRPADCEQFGPEHGIISHNEFLLHCSPAIWEKVLAALVARFGDPPQPSLTECMFCANKTSLPQMWHAREGGVVCPDCRLAGK